MIGKISSIVFLYFEIFKISIDVVVFSIEAITTLLLTLLMLHDLHKKDNNYL